MTDQTDSQPGDVILSTAGAAKAFGFHAAMLDSTGAEAA
jgi:hypothetical protein